MPLSRHTAVAALCATALTPFTAAEVLQVPTDHDTVQAAIDAASSGDTVILAPGTYHERIDFKGKAITVCSSDPSDPMVVLATILDGTDLGGSVVTFATGEGPDSVLNGLVITGGSALNGGGIRCVDASPLIRGSVLSRNSGGDGGAVYAVGGDPTLEACTVSNNSAGNGGGLFAFNGATPTLVSCHVVGNRATEGGGGIRSISAVPVILDSVVCGNDLIDEELHPLALPDIQGPFTDGGGNMVGPHAPPPGAIPPGCAPDLNQDGLVDGADLGLLIAAWGACAP